MSIYQGISYNEEIRKNCVADAPDFVGMKSFENLDPAVDCKAFNEKLKRHYDIYLKVREEYEDKRHRFYTGEEAEEVCLSSLGEKFYAQMQSFDKDSRFKRPEALIAKLKQAIENKLKEPNLDEKYVEKATRYLENIDREVFSYETWNQTMFVYREHFSYCAGVKGYLSVSDFDDLFVVYVDALKELICSGNTCFYAKVTGCKRADQMCFWTDENGFEILKKIAAKYDSKLITPLAFVPYLGKLGLSKELLYSYNYSVAKMIVNYFEYHVKSIDSICVEDLLKSYVHDYSCVNQNLIEDKNKKDFIYTIQEESYGDWLCVIDSFNCMLGRNFSPKETMLVNFEGTRLWLKEPYRSYCSYLQDALNTARIQ